MNVAGERQTIKWNKFSSNGVAQNVTDFIVSVVSGLARRLKKKEEED